ncbi:MAG: hypothetical protein HF981_02435 [Desulfobacteraceae bacterium]|nr:hypothetical protein [Desulfobacteraceae bacterium]MBC2749221.1 hypothetical protein [Desulfobacteraceae bacterium]
MPAIVLDCDYRSQEGIIQPLGRKGIPVFAISSKNDCPAFHSKYVFRKCVSPQLSKNENQYLDYLLNLKIRGVLYYSDDLSAMAISKNKDILIDSGFLLNIPDVDMLENAFDKWACYQIASSIGIPMAKSAIVSNTQDILNEWDAFRKPIIIKGTRLAGGIYKRIFKKSQIEQSWRKINDIVNSEHYSARRSGILMQEWEKYDITDNWSCETLYDQNGQSIGFFTVKRIRSSLNKDGTFSSRLFAGYHKDCPQIVKHTKNILKRMKWKGFAHVEYFYVPDKSKYLLTEVNPRLPGYAYYPSVAGFNMAYNYYLDLIGNRTCYINNFPKSYYFESFHYPGDITQGICHILRGNLSLRSFLSSYLSLISKLKNIIVIDPIRLDDPSYTLHALFKTLKDFQNDCIRFLKNRIKSILYNLHQ